MQNQKNEQALSLTVTEGLTVTILPDLNHEFIISTKEAAHGYGTTDYAIRQTKLRHSTELIEGKHYLSGVTIRHGASAGASKSTMWTKRGIVRLGFFIQSERAKLFRDWAEELIIQVNEQHDLFGVVKTTRALPAKRNHNRITSDRLIRLLQLTHRIEDSSLRTDIVNELMGGHAK
jgi:hypothetical protein